MCSVGREATGGTFFYHKNILWLNELLSYHTFLHTVIYALFHLRCMKVSLEKTAIWQQKRNKEMRKKTLQETKNVIISNSTNRLVVKTKHSHRVTRPWYRCVWTTKVRRSLWSENTRYLAYQEHKYITGEIL